MPVERVSGGTSVTTKPTSYALRAMRLSPKMLDSIAHAQSPVPSVLPGANEFCAVSVCETCGYAKGYTHALKHWQQILDALDALRNDRGMLVICIAHSKVEKFQDPEASAYDRYSPRLNKHASALVCEWSDAVLFATRKFRTQTEDAGFNRKRTIAHALGKDGGERILRCVGLECQGLSRL